jgi:hypothetical protein
MHAKFEKPQASLAFFSFQKVKRGKDIAHIVASSTHLEQDPRTLISARIALSNDEHGNEIMNLEVSRGSCK